MITRQAILHKPLSNYAYAKDETTLVIRLRSARDNLDRVILHYGDTAYPAEFVQYDYLDMEIIYQDPIFDYYEARIEDAYKRSIYYFELINKEETLYYFSDFFYQEISDMRNDLYKFPYMRKEDIKDAPNWLKEAVIYNIFPDSFTDKAQREPKIIDHNGEICKNRLGGTIKTIINSLDYIENLGFNTIYLNPIFTAGEYHKYDLINYYEVDPLFGTNADFKELVEKCHERNMKVIIDGVFNHCGWNFFAFKDVLINQKDSKYVDWFYRLEFPVEIPKPKTLPNYECFGYEKRMPKLNTSNLKVINYFMDVCKYWIKEFDIDGWRLDVADEVNVDFWREFKKTTKALKSECVLIGEVWQNATYFLDGSMFDSAMNYDFLKHCKDFFGKRNIDAFEFDGRISNMYMRYPENLLYAQLNLLDSHDVPRFLSVVKEYIPIYKLAVIFLLTSIGAPSIFYGDEQGLKGIKELDYRSPMSFNNNKKLSEFFREIILLRRNHKALSLGKHKTIQANKNEGLYIYKRFTENESIIIVINNSEKTKELLIEFSKYSILSKYNTSETSVNAYGYLIIKER